jgi:hypothetical protein
MLQWLKSLFADALKQGVLAALALIVPPAAVISATGLGFLTTPHRVAGWAIVGAASLAGVFVFSVALNFMQWRRTALPRSVHLVAEGGFSGEPWWHTGAQGATPAMQICGSFHITNVTSFTITIPKSVLIASYRTWGVIPRRTRVEEAGLYEPLMAQSFVQDQFTWWISPPILKEGQVLHARVGLIDNLGRTSWGEWLDFKYR